MKVIQMQRDAKSIEITRIQGFLDGDLDIFDLIVGPKPAKHRGEETMTD